MGSDEPSRVSMVERVARAIFESEIKHSSWFTAGEGWHRVCRERARAAIEAMREPTEAMVGAAPWGAAPGYRDMIDAALQEEPGDE